MENRREHNKRGKEQTQENKKKAIGVLAEKNIWNYHQSRIPF